MPYPQNWPQPRPVQRVVFESLQGCILTSIIAALEITGLLSKLQEDGLEVDAIADPHIDRALLRSLLAYLIQRGFAYDDRGTVRFTVAGEMLYRDKGYLLWLSGGYAHVLQQLDTFLSGTKTYGREVVRNGHWVAVGSAQVGKVDVVPYLWEYLELLHITHMLDLGCGSGRFLLTACEAFGCTGVGVDINAEACEEAMRNVNAAGLNERVRIVQADVTDVHAIPALEQTQLVSAFFLLHEIFALGEPVFIDYLKEMRALLPANARFLIVEVTPPVHQLATPELFTPEYGLLHAVMSQTLATEQMWKMMLEQAGFTVEYIIPVGVPGGIMILCQSTRHYESE